MPVHSRRLVPSSGRRPQRRKLVWATSVVNAVTVATGAKLAAQDLLANLEVAGSSVLGATVMRTHMDLSVSNATADATIGGFFGFIVNDAPTVTNLDPSSPAQYGFDWMLWEGINQVSCDNSLVLGSSVQYHKKIDLRAKRKIEELAERYWFVMINTGTGTMTISATTRTLVALP